MFQRIKGFFADLTVEENMKVAMKKEDDETSERLD